MISLPFDIITVIASYCTHDDFHYLVNTSKYYFQHIKRRLIVLNLSLAKSLEYLTDVSFRERVLSVVENGWKQVNVHVVEGRWDQFTLLPDLPIHALLVRPQSFSYDESTEASPLDRFGHIEILTGLHCDGFIPSLPRVKELEIIQVHGEVSSDISHLSHLEKLTIGDASSLTDISSLKDIPHIDLYFCSLIKDFSMFHHSRQKSLVLSYCSNLFSVESFRMIHYLELRKCQNLEDISPLYGIHHLVLRSCPKVKDISSLGGHHRLSLNRCGLDMTGYESLLHIPHVSLSLINIIDVSVLRYAKSLSLIQCRLVQDVSSLTNVRTIEIRNCDMVKDVSSLRNVQSLMFEAKRSEGFLSQDQLTLLRNRRLHLEGLDVTPMSFSFLQPEVHNLTLTIHPMFTLLVCYLRNSRIFLNISRICNLLHFTLWISQMRMD